MTKPLKVLMVSGWWPAGPIPFLAQAFERMGLDVFRAGPTYNDHGGVDWGEYKVKTNLEFPREAKTWNIDSIISLATHFGHTPDFLFLSEENYQTEIAPTEKIPTAFWSLDGWPNNYIRGEALKPTVLYANHPRGIRTHPLKEDRPGWKFMCGAAAPWIHKDLGLERDLDFCLLATMYGYRSQLCEYLRESGYLVKYGGYVPTSEFVETYNRSKFTYCNINGNGGELKWRGLESMAMGCVNIVDEGPNLFNRLGYIPNVHYVPVKVSEMENGEPWPTGQALEEALGYSLYDSDCFIEMSKAARGKCLSQDTYTHRAKTVLKDLGFKYQYE